MRIFTTQPTLALRIIALGGVLAIMCIIRTIAAEVPAAHEEPRDQAVEQQSENPPLLANEEDADAESGDGVDWTVEGLKEGAVKTGRAIKSGSVKAANAVKTGAKKTEDAAKKSYDWLKDKFD